MLLEGLVVVILRWLFLIPVELLGDSLKKREFRRLACVSETLELSKACLERNDLFDLTKKSRLWLEA